MATNSQQAPGQKISGLLTIIPNEHRGVQSNTLAQHCVCLRVCCSMGLHYNLTIRISITDLLAHWQLLYTLNTFPFSLWFLFLHPLSFIIPLSFHSKGLLTPLLSLFSTFILPSLLSTHATLSFRPPCIPPFLPSHPSFSSLHPSFFLSPHSLFTLLMSVCLPPPPSRLTPAKTFIFHSSRNSCFNPRERNSFTSAFFSNQSWSPDFYLSLHHLFSISFFSQSLFWPNPQPPPPWTLGLLCVLLWLQGEVPTHGGWCKMGTECFQVTVVAPPLPPHDDNFNLRFGLRF